MTQYKRPDEAVFASGAKPGELEAFPDIARGWGVAFEQTAGIPPMEWFNALFKRTDEAIRYLMQRGVAEWSASESYPVGAIVQYAGRAWMAVQANGNSAPDSSSAYWQERGSNAIGVYSAVPGARRESIVYVPPYGLMEWVDARGLYRSVECGSLLLHTTASPRPGTLKANGQVLSKKAYAGLWSWAQDVGHVVSSQAWAAGTLFYAEMGGDSFRVPDVRGEFLRAWDDGRGVDASRGIGSFQMDSVQKHNHYLPTSSGSYDNPGPAISDNVWTTHTDVNAAPTNGTVATTYWDYGTAGRFSVETRPRNVALLPVIRY